MIPVFSLFILIPLAVTQDIIFPGEVARQSNQQIMEPVPKKECSINMTMVQEDGEDVCECVSGYLYYPSLDSCFKPYTRGPCSNGQHFVLRSGKTTAECLKNPCEEGSVMYHKSCYKLLKAGLPCNKSSESLVISEDNYEIICQDVVPVLYQVIVAPVKHCSPGSKMIARGKCRRSL